MKFCANIMQSLNLMLKKNAIVYVVFSPFYYCLNGSKTFLTTRYYGNRLDGRLFFRLLKSRVILGGFSVNNAQLF